MYFRVKQIIEKEINNSVGTWLCHLVDWMEADLNASLELESKLNQNRSWNWILNWNLLSAQYKMTKTYQPGLNDIKIEITRMCSVTWERWRLQLVWFVWDDLQIIISSTFFLQAVDAHAVSELDHAGLLSKTAIRFLHRGPHHYYEGHFGERNKNKTCGLFSWRCPAFVTSLIIVIQEIWINLPHSSLISFCFN